MQDAQVIARIRGKFRSLRPEMDERMRRQWAATEARDVGWGGITAVARATGLSRVTVTAGMRELELPARQRAAEAARVRRPGAGRRPLTESDSELLAALEALIEPTTRGDPESPLRWTCKSTRRLADELTTTEASGEPRHGGHLVAHGRLQPARQPQDAGRRVASGPQCTVRVHQCTGRSGSKIAASRPSRWTQKRRNWSGISRMADASGDRRANRRKCESTTSWISNWARRFPTACTIC